MLAVQLLLILSLSKFLNEEKCFLQFGFRQTQEVQIVLRDAQ